MRQRHINVHELPGPLRYGLAPYSVTGRGEDAITGVHAIGFTIVDRHPVGVELGYRIRTAGVKGCCLPLRNLLHQSVEFGGRCLVKSERIASSRRNVPMPSTSAVYSGDSKLTATWLCAPRL